MSIKLFTAERSRIALKERCLKDRLAQRPANISKEQFEAAIRIAITDAAADAIMLAKQVMRGHSGVYFMPEGNEACGVAILEALEAIDVQHIIQSCLTLQTLSKEPV